MNIVPIEAPSQALRPALQAKIDNLNKPLHALGRLEELALQIGLIQQTLSPTLRHPCHLLLGGDHGIEREGVSVSPRCVTWQQMLNFARGGGGVNLFCRQHGFRLFIVDVGVDHDLSGVEGIINRKIARGTRDFLHEPAMTEREMEQTLSVGRELVDHCCDAEQSNIICIGEMGIGNTSPSSVWQHLLTGLPLADCVGRGAGLDDAGVNHKLQVLTAACERFRQLYPEPTPELMMRYFGGFEMVAAVGAMLEAARRRMVILVDGYIMTACMLMAQRLQPNTLHYAIFGHSGDEHAHEAMLRQMNAKPLLRLGLRLGEGTGALCAYPIVESAVRMINEMNNFDNANITKYF